MNYKEAAEAGAQSDAYVAGLLVLSLTPVVVSIVLLAVLLRRR